MAAPNVNPNLLQPQMMPTMYNMPMQQSAQGYNPWQVPANGPQPIYGYPTANSALMPTDTLYGVISDTYQLTSKYMSPTWGMPMSQQLAMGYNPFATDNQFSNNPMDMMTQMFMQTMGSMFGMQSQQQQPMPMMGMPQMGMPQMGMPMMGMPQMGMPMMGMPQMGMPQMGMPQMGMPMMGMPQMGMPQMGMPQMGMPQQPQQGGILEQLLQAIESLIGQLKPEEAVKEEPAVAEEKAPAEEAVKEEPVVAEDKAPAEEEKAKDKTDSIIVSVGDNQNVVGTPENDTIIVIGDNNKIDGKGGDDNIFIAGENNQVISSKEKDGADQIVEEKFEAEETTEEKPIEEAIV